MPHLVVDPVVAAAQVIGALQTIASRNVSPVDAVVVSICSMQTSQLGAFNVIPEDVRLIGTVRTFRAETRVLAERRVREIVDRGRRRASVHASINYRRGYPCHHQHASARRLRGERGRARLRHGERGARCRADDGRRGLLVHAAGASRRVRVPRPGWQAPTPASCTIPHYDFNDDVIPLGAGYLAALVEEALPIK